MKKILTPHHFFLSYNLLLCVPVVVGEILSDNHNPYESVKCAFSIMSQLDVFDAAEYVGSLHAMNIALSSYLRRQIMLGTILAVLSVEGWSSSLKWNYSNGGVKLHIQTQLLMSPVLLEFVSIALSCAPF